MRIWIVAVAIASAVAATPVATLAQDGGPRMYGIKIAVKDFQKSIDFYSALGMKLGPKHNAAEWELQWSDPAQGSSIIMVRDIKGAMHIVPGGGFMMISVPDMNATLAKLRSLGFQNIGVPRVTTLSMLLVLKDPDGNQIELLSPVRQ